MSRRDLGMAPSRAASNRAKMESMFGQLDAEEQRMNTEAAATREAAAAGKPARPTPVPYTPPKEKPAKEVSRW